MKKVTVSLIISCYLFVITSIVSYAEEVQNCTQVTQYNGAVGIVCGVHTPVETGFADLNPLVLSSVFFIIAGFGLNEYKKLKKIQLRI